MKKFLIHVGIFSLSLILLAGGIEYMLRQVPNPLAFKRSLLENNAQKTKTLVIGSSVVNCSVNPVFYQTAHIIWPYPENGSDSIRLYWKNISMNSPN